MKKVNMFFPLIFMLCSSLVKRRETVSNEFNVRWGWLKIMYIYTIVGAGGFGLGMILIPGTMQSLFGLPDQDPIILGVMASLYVAFALLSIHGLKSPLKFSPVLMMQLIYKVVWFVGILLPMVIKGTFPNYGILFVVIFVSYIIGDLIAIPFGYIFAKEAD